MRARVTRRFLYHLASLSFGHSEPERPPFPHVQLFYWKSRQRALNFGDHLCWVVVSKVLAGLGHLLEEETPRPARLLAIGSVLHFARDGDIVWGSGVNGKVDPAAHDFKRLDVRAVRGPLTEEFLVRRGIRVPKIYGDPALLLPHLFKDRFNVRPRLPYVVVPNLHDLAHVADWSNVVSPLLPWNTCIERILEGAFVMASSLHGLIVAEAFGIPARYLRLSETEGLLKYQDYALGTGRSTLEFARSREEAMEMGGMEPPLFDHAALLAAFPIDLWRRGDAAGDSTIRVA